MLLVIVFAGSFVVALGIGYVGAAADQGIKIVAESKVGAKVGQWLFLLPLFDFADHLASEVIPDLIRRFVDAVGFGLALVLVLAAICALLAALWFFVSALLFAGLSIFSFLWRHVGWIVFGLIAIFAAVQYAKRILR